MRYLFLPLVIMVLLAGIWLARNYVPQKPRESPVTAGSLAAEEHLGRGPTIPAPGQILPKREAVRQGFEKIPPPPPGRSYPEYPGPPESEDLALQRELAAALRAGGIPESEVQDTVESYFPRRESPTELSPELSPFQTSPEELKEELARALKESGIPPEEIDRMAENFLATIAKQN